MTTADPTVEPELVDHGERLAVGFCRVLRAAGLKVPATATINFGEALGLMGAADRGSVYWAGRATLIHRPEDLNVYDRVFDAYWLQREPGGMTVEGALPPTTLVLDSDDDEPDDEADDEGDGEDPPGEVQQIRFSRVEVLTNKDFAECTPDELRELSALMAGLRFSTYRRQSLRRSPAKRAGDRPDLRRTVRWALRHQGEPVRRAFTEPASRPRRLVLILDVSGSMETYARALLRFAHAAVVARSKVEVFALRHPAHPPDQGPGQPGPRRSDTPGVPPGRRLGRRDPTGGGHPGVQRRLGGAGHGAGQRRGHPERWLGPG